MKKKRDHFHHRYENDPVYRDAFKARVRRYYHEDPGYNESTKKRVKVWQRAYKDRVNETARKRYAAYYGEKDRARRTTDEYRARKLEWERKRLLDPRKKARSRHSLNQYKYRRRAWLAQAGNFTLQEWYELCKRYNHRCVCCGKRKKLTVDHIVPLSRGGSNTIDNVQPLCLDCNRRKNARTADYRPFVQHSLLD